MEHHMQSDELPPNQIQPNQIPPEQAQPNRSREALIGGFVLVIIGGSALASQLWPDLDRYIPLLIGIGLLGVFFITRAYLALVFGAITAGLGIGLLVSNMYPAADADGPGAVLGLGLGFVSIWIISGLMNLKEHHFWPLIPGGILVAVGVGLTLDLFEGDVSKYVVPALVMAFGLLIMIIGYLRMGRTHAGGHV
jgi:hypothetical protein